MSTTAPAVDMDDEVPDYIVQRPFKYAGRMFKRGDMITVAVYRHRTFESLISGGLIKAVLR